MTDEEIDQVVEATESLRPGARWTAPFRRFAMWFVTTRPGNWSTGKTPRWQTIVAVLVVAVPGYLLVSSSTGATNAAQRRADLRQVSNQVYVGQVFTYTQAVASYQICLDGVGRSDANRGQWMQLTDIVAALDAGNGKAIALADELGGGPLLSAPPRTVDDCPVPGPAPVPPAP